MIETTVINFGMVNAFLLKGKDGFILIDSGIPPLWSRLEKELRKANCQPGDLKLVILTHSDMDHTGNASRLKEKYAAKIALHAAELPMLKEGKPLLREANGLIWKLLARSEQKPGQANPDFPADILLEDGQRLDSYGLAASVLHLPGHTPGSIAVLTDDGQLFCGDILANRSKPSLAPLVENQSELLESLEKLKQSHARIIYPGHGKPFSFEKLLMIK